MITLLFMLLLLAMFYIGLFFVALLVCLLPFWLIFKLIEWLL